LAVTALVAVVTLAFGTFDETAGRILATSASIGGYSLLARGAAPAPTAKSAAPQRAAAVIALAGAAIGQVTLLTILWWRGLGQELLVKTCIVSTVTAAALAVVA